MSHRNLHGLPDIPPRFPDLLVTELGANCADPRGGSGRMAEQSPLTGCEPNNLIESFSEYTTINLLSRRNIFSTDINDVPTTATASDVTETLDAGQLPSHCLHGKKR